VLSTAAVGDPAADNHTDLPSITQFLDNSSLRTKWLIVLSMPIVSLLTAAWLFARTQVSQLAADERIAHTQEVKAALLEVVDDLLSPRDADAAAAAWS